MPLLGIKTTTSVCALTKDGTYNHWCIGWCANHLSHLARAPFGYVYVSARGPYWNLIDLDLPDNQILGERPIFGHPDKDDRDWGDEIPLRLLC